MSLLNKPLTSLSEPEPAVEPSWHRIEPHRYRIEGDIIHWQFFGEVTLDHAQQGVAASEPIYERYGYCLSLMNAGGVAKMTPEARRFLGQQSKRQNRESVTAVFNAGVMGIAISLLIAGASRLFSGKEPNFSILKTEAEARSWLAKQRQRIREDHSA